MSRPIVEGETPSQPAMRVMAPRSNPSSSTRRATRTWRWAMARARVVRRDIGPRCGRKAIRPWPLLASAEATCRARSRGGRGKSSCPAQWSVGRTAAGCADRGTVSSPRDDEPASCTPKGGCSPATKGARARDLNTKFTIRKDFRVGSIADVEVGHLTQISLCACAGPDSSSAGLASVSQLGADWFVPRRTGFDRTGGSRVAGSGRPIADQRPPSPATCTRRFFAGRCGFITRSGRTMRNRRKVRG
jgi:hypothetical protein